jgi:oxaloacetate decarboxylase beta subunit
MNVLDTLKTLALESGFASFFWAGGWKNLVMILIAFVLLYLGIVKKFEPLLLVGIAFGCLLVNLSYFGPESTDALYHPELWSQFLDEESEFYHSYGHIMAHGGLLDILYIGVKAGIYPSLIFLGVGAMTDFGPLIANPKSFLLGASAQFGIYAAYMGAMFLGFNDKAAAAIAIIGGADGPTSIYLASKLGQTALMGPIAVAAYSYLSLVPIIQPPIMKALTTEEERKIKMEQLRPVTKLEKILFPVIITIVVVLILPSKAQLVGMLMLGNLFRECGETRQLTETASNALMYIVVILLGTSVGASTSAEAFLNWTTLKIVALGLVAFAFGTFGGVMLGKLLSKITHGKINPLIGSAGVSAVPMAARVSQKVGAQYDPTNFLLMHAMGPNVAGVIGTAVAAGVFMAIFGIV